MHLQILLVAGAKSLSRGNIERKSIQEEDRPPPHSTTRTIAVEYRAVYSALLRLEQGSKDASSNHRDAVSEEGGVGRSRAARGASRGRRVLVLAGSRGLGRTRRGAAGAVARAAVDLGLGGVQRTALGLDVGLALILLPGAGSVGRDAFRVDVLADELCFGLANSHVIV